uniref:Uncharacterized protein n=1 Tax=Leersia perrieri TaxID=77586 RepID=A0A0D9VHT1_9ORYZ
MVKELGKLQAKVQSADMRAQGSVWPSAAQAPSGQFGMPQAQVAPANTAPFASAHNNLSAGYEQPAQAVPCFPTASYYQGAQAVPHCTAPYADANPMAYQQAHGNAGNPTAGYDQNTIYNNPAYCAGYDQKAIYNHSANPASYEQLNTMASPVILPTLAGYVQNVFSNYPGYQAGHGENALLSNCVLYAAHHHPYNPVPVNGGTATAEVSMNSTAGQIQANSGAATVVVAQAAHCPSDGAFYSNPNSGAQM